MDERSIKSWWQRRLPDVSAAIARFPLAVALAALLTVYKLYHGAMIGDVELRVMAWLLASFVWVVGVTFVRRKPAPLGPGAHAALADRHGGARPDSLGSIPPSG